MERVETIFLTGKLELSAAFWNPLFFGKLVSICFFLIQSMGLMMRGFGIPERELT